jgi:hypothetical protein
MTLGVYFMTISVAPSCGVTYDHHSYNYIGVIYDCNIFIIQATGANVIPLFPAVINESS